MTHFRKGLAVAAAVLSLTTLGTGVASAGEDGAKAVVRYTEHGIPHIVAKDFGGLGYGYGYAAATDNVCELAKIYVTVSAQRSRYFGPDGEGYPSLSEAKNNLHSDLFFQQINDSGVADRLVAQPAPQGPRPEVRQIVSGYVKGFNAFLARTGRSGITDPACRGADWVRPITEQDFYRHFYSIAVTGGLGFVTEGLFATPPSGTAAASPGTAAQLSASLRDGLGKGGLGSNGIAIGSDGTAAGKGSVLLGNPHYPWHDGRRFWQSQLTIPGRVDVAGASLLGMPFVMIGHTADAAWTHTVSTPVTFGLFEVPLTPGDPTTYLVDGKAEKMTSRDVTVQVRQADGSLKPVRQTFWATRYGPVLNDVGGFPVPWTAKSAYALRDANATNLRGLNTWIELDQARSTADIVGTLSRTQGVPWVNTIATDRAGNALYADIQVVPHVTDELAARCSTPLGQQTFPGDALAILDGAKSSCQWGSDPGAVEPGIFAPSRLPQQQRRDYELNTNDSAWLANAKAPITGYPHIVGDQATERNPRTREALLTAERGGFTTDSMKQMLFADHSLFADLAAADLAKLCASFPDGLAPSSAGPVPVGPGCAALANWDHTYSLDSRGSLLFQRFAIRLGGVSRFTVPFDPKAPLTTPNTLNVGDAGLQKAFGDALAELRAAGLSPDAPLRDGQSVTRNGERIPIHGAQGFLGVLNVMTPQWDPAHGNTEVAHGSSYLQVVGFSGRACPDSSTLLTYSQSANPKSPYFSDQTKLYSGGEWVKERFCEADILRSPALRTVVLH
ncbi:penicillin acylase family protein [Amycolatopsis balhimycina DSM 5908]|uniref:Penicillin acylase family protein n=1 Tax=Amycolatopsis balhimycina DSM 5908 TaxID=1081091 RepID=A0A428W5I9_AMYBA|nr:penicillin acylase family protein [Amycolatopsis balhimycina]RSM38303.1 penicillin acylase family protein [Amycolatopsis balhimycina DSM 5908]